MKVTYPKSATTAKIKSESAFKYNKNYSDEMNGKKTAKMTVKKLMKKQIPAGQEIQAFPLRIFPSLLLVQMNQERGIISGRLLPPECMSMRIQQFF